LKIQNKIMDEIVASINGHTQKSRPNILSFILWDYGYLESSYKPIARRNKITKTIQIRRYNNFDSIFEWYDANEKFNNRFVKYKYY